MYAVVMRWLICAVAAVILTACGERESGKRTGGLTIAVIPKGTTHEFWKSIEAGARKAGEELDVAIKWDGPLNEGGLKQQIDIVNAMRALGVSGIVLAPTDKEALRRPVEQAIKAGIPVVIIDSGLNSEQQTSFVATDNFRGGAMGGEHLVKLIGETGKQVILLKYQEGSASTEKREAGFRDAATKAGLTIKAEQFAGDTSEKAQATAANMLTPLITDGKLDADGIFASNESTTRGMLNALDDARLAGKVPFVGFDTAEDLVEALKAGQIHALVAQNPRRMGYLGVKTMVQHLRGEPVDERVDTGVELITADRLAEPDIRQLLGLP